MAENIEANSKIKKVAAGYQNAIQIQNYQQQMAQYYADVAQEQINREYKDQIAADQYKYQNEIIQMRNDAQLDAFEKSQQTYENNIKSIDFYAENQKDRIQLGLDEKIAEIGFAQSEVDLAFEKNVMESAYGTAEQNQLITTTEDIRLDETGKLQLEKQSIDNKSSAVDAEIDKIKSNQDIKDTELTIQKRETTDLQEQKKKAQNDKNYAFLQAEVERIQTTGAARARGQKGKSASKQVNALSAIVSVNMSKMVDDLYYSKAALERQRKTSIDRESVIGELKGQLGSDIKIQGYQKANLGIQKQQIDKDISIVNTKAGDTKASADRKKNQIAELLGIQQAEMELDQDKLAEQLLSESEASLIALQELETKTFEAKNKAYEAQMLAPKLEPLMPAPYPTPKTTFVEPQPPVKFPKEAAGMGVGSNAGAQPVSAVSSVLGIASTVAGIAAPFTGGASLAVGAASAGLGFLSSVFK